MDNYIEKIKRAKSIKDLDSIAVDYFFGVEHGTIAYDRNVDLAFRKRESELSHMEIAAEQAMDLVRNQMSEVDVEDVSELEEGKIIPFDLTRKKSKSPNEIIFNPPSQDIKCGCPVKYGVPCIHKTNFDGIVPTDYVECQTCGCDHKYDPRLAKEVHSKLGETI